MIFILSGCFWTSNTTETNTTQDISFSSYVFTIPNSYSSGEVSNRVDSRIVKKIIAVYSSSVSYTHLDVYKRQEKYKVSDPVCVCCPVPSPDTSTMYILLLKTTIFHFTSTEQLSP